MKLTKIITFASLMLNLSVAFAQTNNAASMIQGRVASETEVVQFISKYTYEMKKSYKVFHWFNGGGRNAVWSSPLSASNPSGYDHLVNLGRRYYNSFCSQKNPSVNPSDCTDLSDLQYGRSGFYGAALYTSIDPAATASYGVSSGPNWVLMQVQLPQGYRVLDLMKDDRVAFPQEVLNFFSQEGCANRVTSFYRLIMVGTTNLNGFYNGTTIDSAAEKCALTVRRILKDEVKMDGFFYNYGAAAFQECIKPSDEVTKSAETVALGGYQGPFSQRALIITNPDKMSANDVKVFNTQTPDAKDDRITILSAFDSARSMYSQYLTWQDIGAQERDPKIGKWLKENIIGCKNEVPYRPVSGGAQ